MSARQRAPTGKSNAAWDATTGALSARGNGGAVTRGPSPRPAMAGGEGAGGASARRGSGGISSSLAASALASLTRPLTSAPRRDSGAFNATPRDVQFSARNSGREAGTSRRGAMFGDSMADSQVPETNAMEFLVTKNKQYIERMNAIERASNEKLGEYNEFSRPKASKVLFDPEANNFPKSKTRTELMEKVKRSGMPHLSYDIDGDGWVSRDDFLASKRFDLDGNGVIDPEERLLAKHIVAEEFFLAHMHHIHLFGPGYANKSLKENVETLANSKIFERSYSRLKQIEVKLRQAGSQEMVDGMALADKTLIKYNYYSNKFDTSAWIDTDAIPRSASFALPPNGSRKHLMFMRRESDRAAADEEFQRSLRDKPQTNFRRVNLITDVKNEND